MTYSDMCCSCYCLIKSKTADPRWGGVGLGGTDGCSRWGTQALRVVAWESCDLGDRGCLVFLQMTVKLLVLGKFGLRVSMNMDS